MPTSHGPGEDESPFEPPPAPFRPSGPGVGATPLGMKGEDPFDPSYDDAPDTVAPGRRGDDALGDDGDTGP